MVRGQENYPIGEQNVIVSNHNCLMDIFYLPMSLPEEIVSLISARLLYKNIADRKEMVNQYLHALPIEAHGGNKYVHICLENAIDCLMNGKSVSIFPEGAYIYAQKIFKGHTDASRILYGARMNHQKVNLVPVSISVSLKDDLDDYYQMNDKVEITILPPVDYEESFYNYKYATTLEEKNLCLHHPVDIAMQRIARQLDVPYEDHYIYLIPKGNVMFADGSVVDVTTAQSSFYIERYNRELHDKAMSLLKVMK